MAKQWIELNKSNTVSIDMKQKEKNVVYGKDVRRALKMGNSIGATFPPEFVEAHNIKPGDLLEMPFSQELHIKVIRPEEIREYFERKEEAGKKR